MSCSSHQTNRGREIPNQSRDLYFMRTLRERLPSKRTKGELMEEKYTLDYLTNGGPIFQVKGLYTFTSDSIALAHAVKEERINSCVDLCAGSGVVGLELAGVKFVEKLYLVELQPELIEACRKSVELSPLKTEIKVLNMDVKDTPELIEPNSVDVVITNPPYFKVGSGELPANESRAMARHELKLSLAELIETASKLLKPNGKFYMIHLNSRLPEIERTLNHFDFKILSKILLPGKLERIIIESIKTHR